MLVRHGSQKNPKHWLFNDSVEYVTWRWFVRTESNCLDFELFVQVFEVPLLLFFFVTSYTDQELGDQLSRLIKWPDHGHTVSYVFMPLCSPHFSCWLPIHQLTAQICICVHSGWGWGQNIHSAKKCWCWRKKTSTKLFNPRFLQLKHGERRVLFRRPSSCWWRWLLMSASLLIILRLNAKFHSHYQSLKVIVVCVILGCMLRCSWSQPYFRLFVICGLMTLT